MRYAGRLRMGLDMSKECMDDLTVLLDTVLRRVQNFLPDTSPEVEYVLDVVAAEVGELRRAWSDRILFDNKVAGDEELK